MITILLATIIACFLLGTPAFGQGEDALYVAPSGFIGIGTNSPSNMLQMYDADNSGYNFTAVDFRINLTNDI